jgi:hypothetical protein
MKNLIQAAAVTLFAASTAQAQQAVQWRAEDGGNGHWYALIPESRIWPDARDRAVALGGHLATTTSQAELDFLKPMMIADGGERDYFLGSRRDAVGSPWYWVTGEPMDFTNWWEIGSDPERLYMEVIGRPAAPSFGRWNSERVYAAGGGQRFFVEWDADCNQDGIVDYGQILAGELADTNGNNAPDCCEQGTTCDQLAVGLQAHYLLDGDCLDASGNGRNGSAASISYVAGPRGLAGTAASFDGSSSFIQIDGVPIPADNAFTWALWLRADSLGTSYAYIIERIAGIGNNLLSPGLSVRSNGSLAFGSCCTAGGSETNSPANTVSPGVWAHVACTSSIAGVRRIYVNGALVGEGFAVDYGQQLPKILIGRDRLDCCDRFRGAIDDLRFYSRPLSAAEVAKLYASTAPCMGDILLDGVVNGADLGGLLSYWGPVTSSPVSKTCDLNGDSRVDGSDLGMLLANWGACP